MQTNYAATKKKKWIEYVKNDEKPEQAFAQNFLLHLGLNDLVISAQGKKVVYVSDIMCAFKKADIDKIREEFS